MERNIKSLANLTSKTIVKYIEHCDYLPKHLTEQLLKFIIEHDNELFLDATHEAIIEQEDRGVLQYRMPHNTLLDRKDIQEFIKRGLKFFPNLKIPCIDRPLYSESSFIDNIGQDFLKKIITNSSFAIEPYFFGFHFDEEDNTNYLQFYNICRVEDENDEETNDYFKMDITGVNEIETFVNEKGNTFVRLDDNIYSIQYEMFIETFGDPSINSVVIQKEVFDQNKQGEIKRHHLIKL